MKTRVRNIGVLLELQQQYLNQHFLSSNKLRVRGHVYRQDSEKGIHAFISSRVDCCNGLLSGLLKKTLKYLQLIQSAAKLGEHIT